MYGHRTRTYGEVLKGRIETQKANSECVSYKIDVEKYNQTGKLERITEQKRYEAEPISPETLKQIPCSNVEAINNTRKIAKERREEMAKPSIPKPDKEELAEIIRTGYKEDAVEKYGCSDTTIERWTREYRLGPWRNKTLVEQEERRMDKVNLTDLAEPEPKWGEKDVKSCFGTLNGENDLPEKCSGCGDRWDCQKQFRKNAETPLSEAELCPEGVQKATEGDCKGREGKTLTEASSEANDFSMPEPFGVVSRDVWESHRMIDLSRAISAHIAFGKLEPIKPWMDELSEFVEKKTGWVDNG